MKKNIFKDFFNSYSKNVDNADKLGFWKLSDTIILEIIKKYIPQNIDQDSVVLDAGGGTGRWIIKLSKIYTSKFILYDLSEDMLMQAKKNIMQANIKNRVSIVQGNLCDMGSIPDNKVNYIISLYNPISFIYNAKKAIKEMYRVIKKRGRIIIMGQGFYNAIASKINNYIADSNELDKLVSTSKVKWTKNLPELVTYSKESMEALLTDVGFSMISSFGVPIFIQPGSEDWDPKNKKISNISKALTNNSLFKTILGLEMKFNSVPSMVNRGMNMLMVAEKR